MILYHGTSTEHLEAILRNGLQSRKATQRPSNWRGEIESKPGFVYLTDAYPVYYAMNPALNHDKTNSDILILKVDVDDDELFPDEDFIAWGMVQGGVERPMEALISEVDPTNYRHHWKLYFPRFRERQAARLSSLWARA